MNYNNSTTTYLERELKYKRNHIKSFSTKEKYIEILTKNNEMNIDNNCDDEETHKCCPNCKFNTLVFKQTRVTQPDYEDAILYYVHCVNCNYQNISH